VRCGLSRGLNKLRLQCCNPARQFSKSSHGFSPGPSGASTPVLDDFAGRTCRNTAGDWRGGKPRYVTMPRRSARDVNRAREKEGAPISTYSAASKSRQEIFPRPTSGSPSTGADGTVRCLPRSKVMSEFPTTSLQAKGTADGLNAHHIATEINKACR
jgi:hypothetical protein